MDDRLNYSENTNILSKKLCALGIINKVSNLVSPHVLKLLCCSLFYSHLSYALPTWGGLWGELTNYMKEPGKYFPIIVIEHSQLLSTTIFTVLF